MVKIINQSFLKRFKDKLVKYKGLFIVLVILSLISFLISFLLKNNWRDLSINLSATFIGVVFTIFIIDEIFSNQKEVEYSETYLNTKSDLEMTANMFITYLREPFGFHFSYKDLSTNGNLEKEATNLNRKMIDEIISKIGDNMVSAKPEDWKRLTMNVFMIRNKIDQTISIYKNTMPPLVLGKILSLKKSFEAFDLSFGLLNDLFINEPDKWPKNKFGQENNIRIRNQYLIILKDNIIDVFKKTELLFKELDNWDITK